MMKQPLIRDLAVISDRNTCALTDINGMISWYCPGRFDYEAIFSFLVDTENGGFWTVEAEGKTFKERHFHSRSSVLDTVFIIQKLEFTITDWMPVKADFKGICRRFSKAPSPVKNTIKLRPKYGAVKEAYQQKNTYSIYCSEADLWLQASHPLIMNDEFVSFIIPENEEGWAILSDRENIAVNLDDSINNTIAEWKKIEHLLDYSGPYEVELQDSFRALQQLVYEPTGGIIAAATTSLPEVIGGERNYDYRYVWMRDAALIVGALAQIETIGQIERRFLTFVVGVMQVNQQDHVSPFYTIDQKLLLTSKKLDSSGYRNSKPVQVGNTAADQLQLDAEANILISSKIIYDKHAKRTDWIAVEQIADFICNNWEREDNGIWEEGTTKHYTSSKVFAARGLEFMAVYQEDEAKAKRWRDNAQQIRAFVKEKCMTSTGAYAVYAGSEEVDISSTLFVPWSFDEPDSPAMLATIKQLEAEYCRGNLYWRRLEEFDSAKEGAFLAGTCWMAHYYAIAGNVEKAKLIIDTVLSHTNDLGYLSEEIDINTGEMLGNFPQTFVHSSLICAVHGYKMALAGKDSRIY